MLNLLMNPSEAYNPSLFILKLKLKYKDILIITKYGSNRWTTTKTNT